MQYHLGSYPINWKLRWSIKFVFGFKSLTFKTFGCKSCMICASNIAALKKSCVKLAISSFEHDIGRHNPMCKIFYMKKKKTHNSIQVWLKIGNEKNRHTYSFFKKEFNLNLPRWTMLGIDHSIAYIEWGDCWPQITVHKTWKTIWNGERWWILYIFASFQWTQPKIVSKYKTRCGRTRRIQCWKI